MEITDGKKNGWILVDRKRKARAARRSEFFGRVRNGVRRIFIFLFIATIGVFVFNHHMEIQTLTYAGISHMAKRHSPTPDKLRQSAVNYEKQIEEIAK